MTSIKNKINISLEGLTKICFAMLLVVHMYMILKMLSFYFQGCLVYLLTERI